MNEIIKKNREQGQAWDDEIIASLRSQRNVWMVVAVIALLMAAVSAFAVAALAPLKRVEPIVVEVDKLSGKAEVKSLYEGNVDVLTVQEQLAKYFINKYMVARESFNPNLDLDENYLLVQELSEGVAMKDYAKRFDNNAIFNKYGNNRVKVLINSISFLRNDTATVRYALLEQKAQEQDTETAYIDILQYKFVNVPTDEKTRLENPLGFKVTEYRTDREIVN